VLRTNADLNPLTVMLRYKQLTTGEQTFRTAKHKFDRRPTYHKLDETIRGHLFCSFLALVLKAELEARVAALGLGGSWPALLVDLDALTETEIDQQGKRFLLCADGVALPPTVQPIAFA
jgi:transposase